MFTVCFLTFSRFWKTIDDVLKSKILGEILFCSALFSIKVNPEDDLLGTISDLSSSSSSVIQLKRSQAMPLLREVPPSLF